MMKNRTKILSVLAVVLVLMANLLSPVAVMAKNHLVLLDKYKLMKTPGTVYLAPEEQSYACFDGVRIGDTMQEARHKLKKDFDISHETRRDDGWDIGIDRNHPDYFVMVTYNEGKVAVISYQKNQVVTVDGGTAALD